MSQANGRLKERYLANDNISKIRVIKDGELNKAELDKALSDPFYPRFWPQRLEEIRRRKTPSGIFLNIMGEWAGDWVPKQWQDQMFDTIRACPQHRFYLLTKQPQNLIWSVTNPENCWVGVTATNDSMFARACEFMGRIKATIKFVSFEPLLGPIEATEYMPTAFKIYNQIIIGALTCGGGDLARLTNLYPQLSPMPYGGRYTLQPKVEWVEEIITAADKAGVKVFLKDNLRPLFQQVILEDTHSLTYPSGNLRQEIPSDAH